MQIGEFEHTLLRRPEFVSAENWLDYLVLECGGTTIEEKAGAPRAIDNGGRISFAARASDAYRDRPAVGEGPSRIMTGSAGGRAIPREPAVIEEPPAEIDFCRR